MFDSELSRAGYPTVCMVVLDLDWLISNTFNILLKWYFASAHCSFYIYLFIRFLK